MDFQSLRLYADNLAALHTFYGDVLGFPVLNYNHAELRLKVGRSELIFAPGTGTYHFAFNIPENQYVEATAWLNARVPLIAGKDGLTAFHFADWQADALYFYDPCGNIVEFIARHTLPNARHTPFSAESLEGISEIGIPVDFVPEYVTQLQAKFGVRPYGSCAETFCAVGDEHGLCIIVQKGRLWYPDLIKPASAYPFRLQIRGHMEALQNITFE